ncbi:MAG TPA: hypothetical protein VER98_18560 [Terriglobia bacterium]|nr:hypothetical protein [Terriglobia bacterium]
MDTSDDRIITIKSEPLLVRFEPSLKKEIAKRAEKEGMSEAAIVRMAVRAFLEPPKPARR